MRRADHLYLKQGRCSILVRRVGAAGVRDVAQRVALPVIHMLPCRGSWGPRNRRLVVQINYIGILQKASHSATCALFHYQHTQAAWPQLSTSTTPQAFGLQLECSVNATQLQCMLIIPCFLVLTVIKQHTVWHTRLHPHPAPTLPYPPAHNLPPMPASFSYKNGTGGALPPTNSEPLLHPASPMYMHVLQMPHSDSASVQHSNQHGQCKYMLCQVT
jgi:hypothetical protein